MEVDELAKPRCSFLMIYWLYDIDKAQQLRVWVQSKDQQYWHMLQYWLHYKTLFDI